MYYAIEIIGARHPCYCIKQVFDRRIVIPVDGKRYSTESEARAAAAAAGIRIVRIGNIYEIT